MAETKKTTVGDYSPSNPLGSRPSASARGLDPSTGLYTPGGVSISSNPTDGATSASPDVEKARRGDWYFGTNGIPVVVENSLTDYAMKYNVVSGASELQKLGFSDYVRATLSGVGSGMATAGVTASGLVGGVLGGIKGFVDSLDAAKKTYLDNYLNQEITVETPLTVVEHEDGTKGVIVDTSKLAGAGYLSGRGAKAYNDNSNTGVSIDNNGVLNIKVSAAFADSDSFYELQKNLKELFPNGLTKEDAEKVVDEETGDTLLKQIEDYVKGEEDSFLYSAESIAYFKNIAPNASNESLEEAANTQLAGAFSKKEDLDKLHIAVYDERNNKKEMSASDFLDEILAMSKEERDDYMSSIGSRIKSTKISDDEKVILQAQANALYQASHQKNTKYEGMYIDGFFDSLADAEIGPLGRIGNYFGVNNLETFEANEFYSNLIDIATLGVNIALQQKLSNLFEKGVRAVTSGAGKLIGNNKVGNFLNKIDEYAPSGKRLVKTASDDFGTIAAKRGAQFAMNVAADVGYDGLSFMMHKATGQDYDFMENLTTDLAMDALVTYGPGTYVAAMNPDRGYYRTAKNKKTGKYEVVELTGEELAQRRAEKIANLTKNKAVLATLEIFFDKNTALTRLAVLARALTPDGQTKFRERLRLLGDIRQATREIKALFESDENVKQNWQTFQGVFHEITGGKVKNFTQADSNYINAKINRARFVRSAGDNKGKRVKAIKFYKDAINGVSKERAKQLDRLMDTMKPLMRNALDFYYNNGMITEEYYKKLTTADEKGFIAADDFLPVWSAKNNYSGGDIFQSRKVEKEFKNKERMYNVEDFENPLTTFGNYLNNVMRNVAIQKRAELIIETVSNPNSSIKIASQSKGAGVMEDYALLMEYAPEFETIRNNIVKKIEKYYPTEEEWKQDNIDSINNHQVRKSLTQLGNLREERLSLLAELRKLRNEGKKKFFDEGMSDEEIKRYQEDEAYLKYMLTMNKIEQDGLRKNIYEETVSLLKEQQAKNPFAKSKDFELDDPDAYAEMYVKPGIDAAFKSNDPEGALAVLISHAVEAVNPYLMSREDVIERATQAAAVKFRKKVIAEERKKGRKNESVVDKFIDRLVEKHRNKNAGEVKEGDMASFLATYDSDAPRTIRFYVNGEEQHIVLEGDGAEAIVAEFYAPEATLPTTTLGKIADASLGRLMRGSAKLKRFLTTPAVIARVLPNILRDWARGMVTTGGKILLSPDSMRQKVVESGKLSAEEIEQVNNGFLLANQALRQSTFTYSLESPKKDIYKQMIRGSEEGMQSKSFAQMQLERKGMGLKERLATTREYAKSGYIHYKAEFRNKGFMEKVSIIQDAAETYTRKRAMDTAYYSELSDSLARGESVETAIKNATEAAFFYGREATTNFSRRGKLIEHMSKYVPYFSQKFSSLESLALAYIDNPIAVANSMRTCLGAYATFIAMALSNEESRKRYFLLSEYDRANSIIIPLTNDSIVTIPLDENIAAFFTPYRELIETLYGVDKRAFYLWALDGLAALSPLDLSGFSEGDKFNLQRGLEKMSADAVPTLFLPFLENLSGHTWHYGTEIRVDEDSPWMQSSNPNPTPGELTKSSQNSEFLATIANSTGIPQWQLQEFLDVYGGTIGKYALNVVDNVFGAARPIETFAKPIIDDVFKPFTGSDSDAASNALWKGVNELKDEKHKIEKKIQSINKKIEASSGNEKAKLIEEKQKIVRDYGTRVSDFLDSYAQAYNITGGLSKKEANSIWYLYDLYDESRASKNSYTEGTVEAYYNEKIKKALNNKTTSLAARSGFDKYFNSKALGGYNETYGYQALENSVRGYGTKTMAKIATALEDTSDYNNSYTKLKKDAKSKMDAAFDRGDYDTYNAIAYQYDMMILKAAYPYLKEGGLEESLKNYAVMDYLEDWIYVPTDEMVDAKGRWLSKLPEGAEKSKAYKKRFIMKAYGLLED